MDRLEKRRQTRQRFAATRDAAKLRRYVRLGLAAFLRYRPEVATRDDELVCVHRGALLKTLTGDRCGHRGEQFGLFACAIHGECVVRRLCHDVQQRQCLTCEDLLETPLPPSV